MVTRVYTKHGLRAHYAAPLKLTPGGFQLPAQTFCGHDAYTLGDRSRLFRRRLVRASVCAECDEQQNLADLAR